MATKKKNECYPVAPLRNAIKALEDAEQQIEIGLIEVMTKKMKGENYNLDLLAGNFRAREFCSDRYETAIDNYTRHQDSHNCEIPEDLDNYF